MVLYNFIIYVILIICNIFINKINQTKLSNIQQVHFGKQTLREYIIMKHRNIREFKPIELEYQKSLKEMIENLQKQKCINLLSNTHTQPIILKYQINRENTLSNKFELKKLPFKGNKNKSTSLTTRQKTFLNKTQKISYSMFLQKSKDNEQRAVTNQTSRRSSSLTSRQIKQKYQIFRKPDQTTKDKFSSTMNHFMRKKNKKQQEINNRKYLTSQQKLQKLQKKQWNIIRTYKTCQLHQKPSKSIQKASKFIQKASLHPKTAQKNLPSNIPSQPFLSIQRLSSANLSQHNLHIKQCLDFRELILKEKQVKDRNKVLYKDRNLSRQREKRKIKIIGVGVRKDQEISIQPWRNTYD